MLLTFVCLFTGFFVLKFRGDISSLPLFNQIILYIILIDLFAGIVANLFDETRLYYQEHPKLKRIFVIIHIYPMLICLLAGVPILYGLYIYAYLVAANFILQQIKHIMLQELFVLIFILGAISIIYQMIEVTPFVLTMFGALSIKILFSFSRHLKPERKDVRS